MQRYLKITMIFFLVLNVSTNLLAQASKTEFTFKFNNEQGVKSTYLKQIQDCIDKIKAKKEISVNDNVVLYNALRGIQGKDIFSIPLPKRKNTIKAIIGDKDYSVIEGYYNKLLEKDDASAKKLAMSILGPGLFADQCVDKIKENVFTDDFGLQYKAVWSLAYFEVKGMSALLSNFVFAGRLSAASRLAVLEALNDTNAPELEIVGLWIISHEENPSFLSIALDNIKKTKSYTEAVEKIFLSNQFPISNNKDLSKKEQDNNGLNYYLLMALYENWGNLQNKDKILEKISGALDNQYADIYQYSAFIINKYGTGEQKELLKQVAAKAGDGNRKKFLERVLAGKQQ